MPAYMVEEWGFTVPNKKLFDLAQKVIEWQSEFYNKLDNGKLLNAAGDPLTRKSLNSRRGYLVNITNEVIKITSKRYLMAVNLYSGMEKIEAWVKSGYEVIGYFRRAQDFSYKLVRASMLKNIKNNVINDDVMKLVAHFGKQSITNLNLDKEWVLKEQVNLFYLCKKEKQFTVAAKLLSDISSHVLVDAKVSNRLEVTSEEIDYAKVLAAARARGQSEIATLKRTGKTATDNIVEISYAKK